MANSEEGHFERFCADNNLDPNLLVYLRPGTFGNPSDDTEDRLFLFKKGINVALEADEIMPAVIEGRATYIFTPNDPLEDLSIDAMLELEVRFGFSLFDPSCDMVLYDRLDDFLRENGSMS